MWLGAVAHRIILPLPVSSRLTSNALGAGSGAGRTGRIGTSPIWHRLLGSRVAVRIKLDFTAAACQDQCTVLLPTAHVVQSETFFYLWQPNNVRGLCRCSWAPRRTRRMPPRGFLPAHQSLAFHPEGISVNSRVFSCALSCTPPTPSRHPTIEVFWKSTLAPSLAPALKSQIPLYFSTRTKEAFQASARAPQSTRHNNERKKKV